ncbi:DUF4065 domain-containing protein, partial [Microbacteriaceae bacterium K1510]|nr:DUF4065 domain-containing protein [Microbacteriaceae bacterium K1510]
MTSKAPYDSRAVANFLLDLASKRRLILTQLVLYKVIYFAHGWYLSSFDRPLVSHDFEAWQRGPVIKVLRDQFREFADQPITSRAVKLNIFTGEHTEVPPDLEEQDGEFVSNIFESYFHYGAWKLSEMTHEKGSPWDRLWNSANPVGRLA